jgi:hypothetical protein
MAEDTVKDVLLARPSRVALLTNRHLAYLVVKQSIQVCGVLGGKSCGPQQKLFCCCPNGLLRCGDFKLPYKRLEMTIAMVCCNSHMN